MNHRPLYPMLTTLLLAAAVLLPACQSYELQGRVIEGPQSGVVVVDRDDPRLSEGHGVSGVDLTLTLDPRRLTAQELGQGRTSRDGTFAIAIDEFGAGFLEHDVRLQSHTSEFQDVLEDFRLPSKRKRVLVVLRSHAAGPSDRNEQPRDRDPRDGPEGRELLDETMEWGEPYMD